MSRFPWADFTAYLVGSLALLTLAAFAITTGAWALGAVFLALFALLLTVELRHADTRAACDALAEQLRSQGDRP